MKNTIKQIVFEEFSRLTDLIERDFATNYKRKVNNFLLSQMDENITASMVFVSSFESKSGFAIETCAKRIARLKFGEENVPTIVNPRNLTHSFDEARISGEVAVSKSSSYNQYYVAEFLSRYKAESVYDTIKNTLSNNKAAEYVTQISQELEIKDVNNNFKYLTKTAEAE